MRKGWTVVAMAPGAILVALGLFADVMPWGGTRDGFGDLQVVACLVGLIAMAIGSQVTQLRLPVRLSDIREVVFNLNFALLASVACLAVVEVGAYTLHQIRERSSIRDSHTREAYATAMEYFDWKDEHAENVRKNRPKLEYRPYSLWGYPTVRSSTFNVDPHWGGVRRTINPINEGAGDPVRVFMFGGSTLFCIESTDATTLPSAVSQELHEQYEHLNFEVTNFGVEGQIGDQEIVRLTQVLTEGGQPDIVIFYDGVNGTINKVARGLPHDDAPRFESAINGRYRTETVMLDLILKYDYVHRLVGNGRSDVVSDLLSQDDRKLTARAEAMARRYRQNIDFTRNLGKSFGFEVAHFWQPHIFNTGKHLTQVERNILEGDKEQAVRRIYVIADRIVQTELNGVEGFFNLSDSLDQVGESVFSDFAHVSAIANREIARKIVAKLREAGLLD